jgi:hypothetical protein
MSDCGAGMSHAEREALLYEFADLVRATISDDKPALVTADQLDRCGRAFDSTWLDDWRCVDHILAELHALMVDIFDVAADGGDVPKFLWIRMERGGPPVRFSTTAAPADAEAVTP